MLNIVQDIAAGEDQKVQTKNGNGTSSMLPIDLRETMQKPAVMLVNLLLHNLSNNNLAPLMVFRHTSTKSLRKLLEISTVEHQNRGSSVI